MRISHTLCGLLFLTVAAMLAGCGGGDKGGGGAANGGGTTTSGTGGSSEAKPVFSLAWSEYPSWSVFGVAHTKKLINGAEGQLSTLEMKWGVDIVLKQLTYDACLQQYGAGQVDSVCITNMDVLSPSLGRASVAICPTSTSNGADALIVVGIDDVMQLREHKVYGLDKSVSEYCFVRNLELLGEKESDHKFTSKGPDEAALAMQSNPESTKAIMVWNPFVLQTERKVKGAKRLFDSSKIPGEIVDMLVMSKDSLAKPGGKEFACAIIDTFYQVSDMIEDPKTRDETLVALAAKFAPELTAKDMEQVVTETAFYKTPEAGMELFGSAEFKETMKKVMAFCTSHGMVDKEPQIAYGEGEGQLRFDTTYMQMVKDKK
jgi:NitT/TauT family transport system substrate-binding protein